MDIARPYLLFLGDAADPLAAKTAAGVRDWRPDWCVGQWRLPGCTVDLGLPDMDPAQAAAQGVRTAVIGVVNAGGVLPDHWVTGLVGALEAGLDLAAGLHTRLSSLPALAQTAARTGRALHDVRHSDVRFATGKGTKRSGRRVLTVGTDCSIGKKYTALALEAGLRARGIRADFCATGQTGVLIAGRGVAIDAVVADFISGAAEWLSPAADPDHWDVIEGQGSLYHPSFAGVSLGLLHGSQPDAIVLCHEPTRRTMRGLPDRPLPSVAACIEGNLAMGRLTNPDIRCIGLSVDTHNLPPEERRACLDALSAEHGLPATDPIAFGVDVLVDALLALPVSARP